MFAPPLPELEVRPSLVLTATRRQALWLSRSLGESARCGGELPVPVLHLERFLARTWERHLLNDTAAPRLLSPLREYAWFERGLQRQPPPTPPLRVQDFLTSLQDAWRTALEWDLPPLGSGPLGGDDDPPDVAWFADFANRLATDLERAGWITAAELRQRLSQLEPDALKQALRVAGPILMIGHHEPTPALRRWQQALERAGCEVRAWEPAPPVATDVALHRCADADAEIDAAACWCRSLLDDGADGDDSHSPRVIVVVPGLTGCRERVRARFAAWLDPHWLDPTRPARPPAFNISGADRLADLPVIARALKLISACLEPVEAEVIGRLLVSCIPTAPAATPASTPASPPASPPPSTAPTIERLVRIDAALRERACGPVTLLGWLDQAASVDRLAALEPLRRGVRALVAAAERQQRRPLAAWWGEFDALLAAAGWPGGQEIASEHWQIVETWQRLDADIAALTATRPSLTAQDMVAALRTAARLRQTAPQGASAPVQVCGPLEADGLACTHMWVMGLRSDRWPAPPRPSPFLPLQAQRRAAAPHSSLARETRYSRDLLARLARGCGVLRLSVPLRDARGAVSASHLLTLFDAAPWAEATPAPGSESLDAWAPVRARAGSRADTTLALTDATARGGTGLLDFQARCPFGALYRYRLDARAPRTRAPWPEAGERGSALHRALESFWAGLPDLEALRALSAAALDQRLQQAVDQGIATLDRGFAASQLRLERERLLRVLRDWVEVERSRAPFAIDHTERPQSARFGAMRLTLQADRVERIEADGETRLVIVDYKTGTSPPAPDRSRQLQAYAIALTDTGGSIGALLIARVGPGSDRKLHVHRLIESIEIGADRWQQRRPAMPPPDPAHQLDDWRRALNALADGHAEGDLEINPEATARACADCESWGICRWPGVRGSRR